MKYSKTGVKELLDNNTHVLKIEHTEDFTKLVKELYPKDNWLAKHPIDYAEGYYLIKSADNNERWSWTDFETDRIVILFSEIEKEEVIWLHNEMQVRFIGSEWVDCNDYSSIEYRLKPKKCNKELELEKLAEELGYELKKK